MDLLTGKQQYLPGKNKYQSFTFSPDGQTLVMAVEVYPKGTGIVLSSSYRPEDQVFTLSELKFVRALDTWARRGNSTTFPTTLSRSRTEGAGNVGIVSFANSPRKEVQAFPAAAFAIARGGPSPTSAITAMATACRSRGWPGAWV